MTLESRIKKLEQRVVKLEAQRLLDDGIAEDPVEVATPLYRGRKTRPPENAMGWEEYDVRTALGVYTMKRWRNPNTGEVDWIDYPPQQTYDKDWYFIASGARDVTAPIWNMMWMPAEFINEKYEERGMNRIRLYGGELRSNPGMWPEPFRKAWFETH